MQRNDAAMPSCEAHQMQPDPGITEQQRNAGEQQPAHRIAGGSANARPLHLSITGFDAESSPVGLANPGNRSGVKSPVGIDERMTATPALAAGIISAADADVDSRSRSSPSSTAPGMTIPATALLLEEPRCAAWRLAFISRPPSRSPERHKEGRACSLQ